MHRNAALQIIAIEPLAPTKPALGQACNGCGWCCSLEPCPLGRLVSRRKQGACAALRWDAPSRRYLCGLVSAPETVLPRLGPRRAAWVSKLALRWISAASGCDAELEGWAREADQP